MSEMVETFEELEKVCKTLGFRTVSLDWTGEHYNLDIEESRRPKLTEEEYLALAGSLVKKPINLKKSKESGFAGLPQEFTYYGKLVLKIRLYCPADQLYEIVGFKISRGYKKRNDVLDHLVAMLKIDGESQTEKV